MNNPEDQHPHSQEVNEQGPVLGGAEDNPPGTPDAYDGLSIRDRIDLWNRLIIGELSDLLLPIGLFPAQETEVHRYMPLIMPQALSGELTNTEREDTVDLNTYYEHARLLQHQAEEAERMEAEKREEAILSQWRIVAAKLRELLPVEGMKFVATFDGQFNEAPVKYRMGFDVDCVIRPDVLPIPLGECKLKRSDLNDRKGVIRATVYWDDDASPAGWDVHSYVVSVKGQDVRFTAPYLAFIAAYDELQAETQENT